MTTIDLWVDLSQGVANTQIEFEFSLLTFAEGELEIESLLTCDAEGKKKKKTYFKTCAMFNDFMVLVVFIQFLGCPFGNIVAIPLTGLLTKYGFDGGWPSVFYCFGKLLLLII